MHPTVWMVLLYARNTHAENANGVLKLMLDMRWNLYLLWYGGQPGFPSDLS